MLINAADHAIRRELVEFIKDLDVDEAAALVGWPGSAAAISIPRSGETRSQRPNSGPKVRPGNIFWGSPYCQTISRTRSTPSGARARGWGPRTKAEASSARKPGKLKSEISATDVKTQKISASNR
jgi:hypothetical protein